MILLKKVEALRVLRMIQLSSISSLEPLQDASACLRNSLPWRPCCDRVGSRQRLALSVSSYLECTARTRNQSSQSLQDQAHFWRGGHPWSKGELRPRQHLDAQLDHSRGASSRDLRHLFQCPATLPQCWNALSSSGTLLRIVAHLSPWSARLIWVPAIQEEPRSARLALRDPSPRRVPCEDRVQQTHSQLTTCQSCLCSS